MILSTRKAEASRKCMNMPLSSLATHNDPHREHVGVPGHAGRAVLGLQLVGTRFHLLGRLLDHIEVRFCAGTRRAQIRPQPRCCRGRMPDSWLNLRVSTSFWTTQAANGVRGAEPTNAGALVGSAEVRQHAPRLQGACKAMSIAQFPQSLHGSCRLLNVKSLCRRIGRPAGNIGQCCISANRTAARYACRALNRQTRAGHVSITIADQCDSPIRDMAAEHAPVSSCISRQVPTTSCRAAILRPGQLRRPTAPGEGRPRRVAWMRATSAAASCRV